MSSLVLLNSEGVVVRKLQFVSLPDGYVVPEGMMVSWRTAIEISFSSPSWFPVEPVEAYFCLGNAQGQVCRSDVTRVEWVNMCVSRYGVRTLNITVQGTSAKDVMGLRDRIMHLINSGARWEVSNDLNPKPKTGFLHWLKKKVGMAK